MKKTIAIMSAILVVQVLGIILWACQKDNFYWDEYYTLERAHYVSEKNENDHYIIDDDRFNYNTWIDAKVVRDTLIVDDKSSVLYDDFFLTLSKLFKTNSYSVLLNIITYVIAPGKITYWPSVILNIILFILNQIVLFCLSKNIFHDDFWGYTVISFYGFSALCISMTTFVRFYMLATLMTTMFTFLHCLYWNCKEEQFARKSLLLVGTLICLLIGYNNAQFVIIYAFFFIISFTVLLWVCKGPKISMYYFAPIAIIGIGFIAKKTNIFNVLANFNEIGNMANQAGALGWFIGQIYTFRLNMLPGRMKDIYVIFGEKLFGNVALLCLYFVVIAFGKIIKTDEKSIGKEQFTIIFPVVFYLAFFTAFGLYGQIRYISFVFPEVALILMGVLYQLYGSGKNIKKVVLIFLIAQVIVVNLSGNIDMLYIGDKDRIDNIKEQSIDSIIMTRKSFMPFAVYQSSLIGDDETQLMVYDDQNTNDISTQLRDKMLILVEDENMDIVNYLKGKEYSVKNIGNTYYFKVFTAEK
ncbi:hypothetical protein [Butyrivibrio hungatei]|uniref:Glycosyltransferase RgtA/B/C/D-like domain-containing protein n=1 Tax=Butyrivibrio hungatei TaxID=185008 RepID=A0A1D9NYR5_9FIRM|nr:hypothetical protein [Butyrivibrio hungatei]AOZ95487.1 hypothetical protein bhn_I0453 [Butyrivibrio hungatei]